MSEWDFWHEQLAGLTPDTTPGVPHAGFYLSRRRSTTYDPILGQRRNKVTIKLEPVAIWIEDGKWQCVVGIVGDQQHYDDPDMIDEIFSYCCRSAITHEEYEACMEMNDENQ